MYMHDKKMTYCDKHVSSRKCIFFVVEGPSMQMASKRTTLSLIAPRTPTQGQGFHLIGSGAISSAANTHVFFMIKGASSLTCVLTAKPLLVFHALKKPLTASATLAY